MQDALLEQLDQARAQYVAGAVADAVSSCVVVVEGCTDDTDPLLVAAAATLVRRPVDPLLRARVHALASEALALLRRAGPTGEKAAVRVAAQVEATRDVFRDDQPVEVDDWTDGESEFVEIQARVAALQDPLRADDRLALARRAVAMGLAMGDREMQAWGRLWSMDVHASNGRRVELLGDLSALTVLAEQLGPAWQSRVLLVRASQALMDGRFDAAVRRAEEAATIGGPHSDAAFLRLPFAFEAARYQGTAKRLLQAVGEQVEHLPFVARTWLCLALKSAGLRAEAADEWRALASHVTAVPLEAPEFLMAVADAADVCAWLGDEANAATLYATCCRTSASTSSPTPTRRTKAPWAWFSAAWLECWATSPQQASICGRRWRPPRRCTHCQPRRTCSPSSQPSSRPARAPAASTPTSRSGWHGGSAWRRWSTSSTRCSGHARETRCSPLARPRSRCWSPGA